MFTYIHICFNISRYMYIYIYTYAETYVLIIHTYVCTFLFVCVNVLWLICDAYMAYHCSRVYIYVVDMWCYMYDIFWIYFCNYNVCIGLGMFT